MPELIRKVSPTRWADFIESPLWAKGQCPAEAIAELLKSGHPISFWRVQQSDQIPRIVAGISAHWDTLSDFAYVSIDERWFKESGLKLRQSVGHSADPDVKAWHVDVVAFTDADFVKIAARVCEAIQSGGHQLLEKKRVGNMLIESVRNSYIQPRTIAQKLWTDLWNNQLIGRA